VNWQPMIEFFVSVGYGVLSSLIPIFNSEIYIVASQEVTTAVGCAVGQTIGKVGIVLALRRGSRPRLMQRIPRRRERPRKPAGRVRTKVRAWSDRLLEAATAAASIRAAVRNHGQRCPVRLRPYRSVAAQVTQKLI
jgi:hypothetical protein